MTASEIAARLAEVLGPAVVEASHLDGLHPWVVVPVGQWLQVARFLRDDPAIRLDMLRSITGLDYPDKKLLCAAYDLMSFEHRHEFCVKVLVGREGTPTIGSVSHVWRAAEWHEREAYDLLGINFSDHPDAVTETVDGQEIAHPRRILLPDDWVGFPLRKDYVFPREYEGIPGSVELDWAQKAEYPK